jgi:glycyl-tRNA synthetase beta chain
MLPLQRTPTGPGNHFIAVANIESRDVPAMTAGFERVIRPRLADARFFWNKDGKTPLEATPFAARRGAFPGKTGFGR